MNVHIVKSKPMWADIEIFYYFFDKGEALRFARDLKKNTFSTPTYMGFGKAKFDTFQAPYVYKGSSISRKKEKTYGMRRFYWPKEVHLA